MRDLNFLYCVWLYNIKGRVGCMWKRVYHAVQLIALSPIAHSYRKLALSCMMCHYQMLMIWATMYCITTIACYQDIITSKQRFLNDREVILFNEIWGPGVSKSGWAYCLGASFLGGNDIDTVNCFCRRKWGVKCNVKGHSLGLGNCRFIIKIWS